MNGLTIPARRVYAIFGGKLRTPETAFHAKYRAIKQGYAVNYTEYDFPATRAWLRACYNTPHIAELRLAALDELLEGFGVETIDPAETKNGFRIDYINMGDPYVPTIIYCAAWKYRYRIGAWGDYVKLA
jgi:hypothetical protein